MSSSSPPTPGSWRRASPSLAFATEFESSDRLGVSVADNYEFLTEPFEPGPGVTLPIGGYGFRDMEATYTGGAQPFAERYGDRSCG